MKRITHLMQLFPNHRNFLIAVLLLTAADSIPNAHAEAVADLVVGYGATEAARFGSESALQATVYAQVATANDVAKNSGSPHRQNVAGFKQSATDVDGWTWCTGVIEYLYSYSNLGDVTSYGDALGADLVTYICKMNTGETSAAVAEQPGRYSAYNDWNGLGSVVWYPYFAHESGGHNFGLAHEVGRAYPTTIMLHNYCGTSQGYYSNPNIWLDGAQLLGDGGCLGNVQQGGDAAYYASTTAQVVADRYERVVYGSSLGNVIYRWQFTNSPASAPAGTVVADEVSSAQAVVRGNGATFTGSALRLPGGTTGNTDANSIAAYIDLPNGLFSAMPNFTVEIWATPLSAQNWMRVMEIGRTTQTGDGGGEWTCTPGSAPPGTTDGSDVIGLAAARDTGTLNQQRMISGTNGTWQTADSSLSTTAGAMHHYAITFANTSSGGTVTWYRDGILVESLDVLFHSSDIEDVNNWLGRSLWSADQMANMDYHDVRIENVALNAGQVAANYRIGPNDQMVTLRTSDDWSTHTSAFVSGAWEFGQTTPDASHDYEVGTLLMRTPYDAINRTFSGRSLTLSGGQLHINATGAKTTTINDLRLNGGTVGSFGDGGAVQTLAGQITVQSGTENQIRGGWGPMIISANITGDGTMLYTENTVTLSGNNTGFYGQTVIGDGRFSTLKISSEADLGANPSTFGGAWLELNRGILETTQTMTIDDANRGICIGPSGGFLNADPGTTLTIATPISSPAAGDTLQTAPMDSNPIQGILFFGGGGIVELTNPNNSHNGEIQISSGEFKLSGNGRINNGEHWMPFVVNGTFTDNSAYDQILSGGISGNGSIIKNGSTTLTLDGASTFSGSTIVNSGMLLLNGSNSSGSGTITVAGGILGGTGTAGGSLTVQSGGTLSPGASIGTLTVNANTTLQSGSTTHMEINASSDTCDLLDVAGTATLGGTLEVVNLGGTLVYGDSFMLFDANSISGSFDSYDLPALDAGLQWDTNNIQSGFLVVDSTTPSAPPAPTGLQVITLTDTQLRLEWSPAVGAASYTVKRSTSSGGPYTTIASGITDISFIDSGLTAGTTYYYVVSAVNAIGESAEGSETRGDTALTVGEWNFDQNPAYASTPLSAHPASDLTGNGNSMYGYDATWGAYYTALTPTGSGLSLNANGSQDAYLDDAASFPSFNLNTWSPESWTIEATVVMDDISGWRTFIGKDGTIHAQADSDFYLQKSDDVGDVRIALSTVSGQRVVINTGFFPSVGQWFHLAVTSDGSTLSIYVNDGTGWSLTGSAALTGGSAANNALANGNGGVWTFMRGWYDGGFGDRVDGRIDDIRFSQGARSPVSFLYGSLTMPSTPTGLVASALSADEIALSWSASASATGYYVKRSTSAGGPYTTIGETSGTSFNDTGLVAGSAYHYVVSAISADAASGNSDEASAVPSPTTFAPEESAIAGQTVVGGTNLSLTVSNTVLGHWYTILATDTLTPPLWTTNVIEAGTGSNVLFGIPIDSASTNRYFRLKVERQ